ncbi:MAG: hypothetical protein Q7J76_11025 [Candidatus Brocadiaceae bacterium]|nr:hypothetical protein [Candidatus Brocadiaceae bacterium]
MGEQFCNAEIAELELNRLILVRHHFVLHKGRENIAGMDVLMYIIIYMQIMYCLQETPCNRHEPVLTVEFVVLKEFCNGAVAPLGDNVDVSLNSKAS